MPKLLEVIVTSETDAMEAEQGGADRLELVRALDQGGLTPEPGLVQQVLASVSVPVRVMLRENASMSAGGSAAFEALQSRAQALTQLSVDGFVIGFIEHGCLDVDSLRRLLEALPGRRATFHRAFDELKEPVRAIA